MALSGNSLSFRLFLVTALWSAIALLAAGLLLSGVYRQTAEQRFERELSLYLNNLVAQIEFGPDNTLRDRPNLQDARFQSVLSGWYWQVVRPTAAGTAVSFRSLSLAGETLQPPDPFNVPFDADFRRTLELTGPADQPLLAVEAQVLIDDRLATILVSGALDDVESDVSAFQRVIVWSLGLFGAGLLFGTLAVVWIGLRPLAEISRSLGDIRAGRAERLEGTFPSEIQPLANEVNALIGANQDIVERARTHVGNLAHALKTPLSVLSNEAATAGKEDVGGLAETVRQQAAAMRNQIDYYLKRARVAGAVTVVGAVHPIDETIDSLLRTLSKINRDREIEAGRRGEHGVQFRGERQDFEEIVGNLLENAFKWAKGRIDVEISSEGETPFHRPAFVMVIADDGPGLDPNDRERALKRGQRLDEQTPGTGLGLSIVADLVSLYGGEIVLDTSSLGGLAVRVVLPRAGG